MRPLRYLTILLLFVSYIDAQENPPAGLNFHRWGSVTVFNGLPSDNVRAIAQTPDGILWFGTDNGLARFDGRRVQTFTFGTSDANHILTLKTDEHRGLIVGTQKGGFLHSDNNFIPIKGTENVAISAINVGPDIFLGTDEGRVLRLGEGLVEPLNADPITDQEGKPVTINALAQTEVFLVATSGRGLLFWNGERFSEYKLSPRPLFVNALSVDDKNELWFGTDTKNAGSGIGLVDDGRAIRFGASTSNISTLENVGVETWAGSSKSGLFRISGGRIENFTFENTLGGLRSNNVNTVFVDREGVIWVGTNRGVSRYDPFGPLQEQVSESPNGNFIRTLSTFPYTEMYAGTNRGLFVPRNGRWSSVDGFSNKTVYALGHNKDGILIGTSSGTFDLKGTLLIDGDTRAIESFGDTYAAIIGKGVVDTSNGENIFPDEAANALAVGLDKRMWIGTSDHGLFSFDGHSVKQEASSDILKSGTIWRIVGSVDGRIWIAGQHGVFAFKDGKAEQIIACEDVRDVFVADDDIWAATTTRGLLHAKLDKQFGWLVSEIGFEQGLPSQKAFAIQPIGGMTIATNRGIVSYFPQEIAPKIIPIRVLSQRVHDLSELTSVIELEYPQNSLLVEVAGLSSRTFPEEFQYGFLLKNGKGEIVDKRLSNDPQYAPAELKPGEYIIEARAFDRDLNESEPLVIHFSVAKAPFPWTATILGVLLAVALAALVWAIVEHSRIRHRNRELAAARLDLANEAERERRRIARDLHDQTLADLRNLMIESDNILPENNVFRPEIEAVSTEVRRICEDLSPSVLENVGLVAALEFLLDRTIENKKFTADESVEEQIKFPRDTQLQIYRIAQEVLTNINKHSDAKMVGMNVAANDEDGFSLTITDDGPPFSPDGNGKGKGRGIANIRARASLINATVDWQYDDGNMFTLRSER